MTPDERAIRNLIATWMKASQAGDLETVLGLVKFPVMAGFVTASRVYPTCGNR